MINVEQVREDARTALKACDQTDVKHIAALALVIRLADMVEDLQTQINEMQPFHFAQD